MKKSFGKMFLKGFLQSFFIVVILVLVGVLGYRATTHFLGAPQEDAIIAYQEETIPKQIIEAKVDLVSKNLIFCYDENTKEITKLVLEVFHSESGQLTYITVPLRTQLNISEPLYRKLTVVNPAMPQVLQFSVINQYLEGDAVFEYGTLMMEDLFGIDISYYTVISKATYDEIFESTYLKVDDKSQSNGSMPLPIETFTKSYKKFLKSLKSKDALKAYIEEIYQELRSNLSLSDKLKYLNYYDEMSMNQIDFLLIKGQNKNSAYIIDVGPAAKQLNDLFNTNYIN